MDRLMTANNATLWGYWTGFLWNSHISLLHVLYTH